jgi:hypothetical protein
MFGEHPLSLCRAPHLFITLGMKIGLLLPGLAVIAAVSHADEPPKSNVCDLFDSPQAHLGELIEFDAFIVYDEGAWVLPADECRRNGVALRADIEEIFEDPIFLRSRDLSTAEKPYAVQLTVEGRVMHWPSDDGAFYFAVTEYRDARLVVSERAYDWFEEPPPPPAAYETPTHSR